MAEGELSMGIDADDESTSTWSALPKAMQHMVLSHLPIKSLCVMPCVCKEWRRVLHRREFRTMYDTVNESQEESPSICYVESSYPARLVLSSYDFAAKRWERMSGFQSCPRLDFDPLQRHTWPLNFYSVGGLLCLYFWKADRKAGFMQGVSSWVVWQPFRNIWKKLPPCNQRISTRGACFAHAWVSDERARTYKLLMAHDPRNHWDEESRSKLVTEVYDSATGAWTLGSEYSLRHSEPPHQNVRCLGRGVLFNGMIYFCLGGINNVLLSYDILRDQWHEDVRNRNCVLIFEWDGRLMSITAFGADNFNFVSDFHEGDTLFVVEERNPNSGTWTDTGIEIPLKVRRKFHALGTINVVARGNDLAMIGYAEDASLKIAVYKRAENYWRLPPTGTFSDKLRSVRVDGLVLHKPQLDWFP